MALQLTSQNMEHLFGGVLLQYLVGKLEDIKYPEELNTGEGGASDGQVQLDLGQTGSDQGDGSIGIDGEGGGQGDGSDGINGDGVGQGNDDVDEKIDFKTKLLKVSEKLSHVLKENEKTLFDEQLMSVLPKIIEQLIAQKEQETIEKIINNLTGNLFSEKVEVRAHAAKSLTDIIKSLPAEREKEMLESLSDKLTEWIIFETEVTPAYKTICHYLQNIVQDFINQVRYEETLPILDAFNNINTGTLKKSEQVFEVCAQVIRSLATEENINTLFKEFKTDEHSKKDEAGKILTDFGDVVTKHMLDTLQEDIDSNERVRIMHLIIEIGDKAIPLVRQRVNKDAPWYYLRNMAYILGQIGNEESAVTLQTLLRHENEKLRNEALKSISKTGGNRRGELLISVLPDADENFKLNIIEAIGNAKAVDIVPDLLGILTTRPFVTKAARTILEEKICNALGMIGSAKAIPALSEIAKSKSFFRIRTYPDKVKVAAAKALASIRKKQEEVAQIIKTIR